MTMGTQNQSPAVSAGTPAEPTRRLRLPATLQWRLTALITLCLTAAILAYGTYMAQVQIELTRHNTSYQMEVLARNMAAISAHFLATDDLAGLEEASARFVAEPGLHSLRISNATGSPLAELINQNGRWTPRFDNTRMAPPAVAQLTRQPALSTGLSTVWCPIEAGSLLGWVRVQFQLPSFWQVAWGIWLQSLWVIALASAATLGLLIHLLRAPLQALNKATQFALALDKSLGTQITPYPGVSEFESLGKALNSMSQRLYTQHEEIVWNQSLLQMMSGSSPLAFLVVDNRTDEILYFNPRFCEIWGIEHLAAQMGRGELKNKDIIPACLTVLRDIPAFAASCAPLQDEANRVTLEDEIAFTHDRTIRRFSTQIRDAQDGYCGRFYIFEDISERSQTQQRLSAALRDGQALLQALNAHTILSSTNRGGTIIEANDAFCAISGYSRDELCGQNHRIINSGVQCEDFWATVWKTIACGQSWRGEVCNRAKDGHLYWMDTVIAPYLGEDGRIEKYTSIRLDITASKQKTLLLEQATQAAQAASQAKSHFLANMSHEIRTPMNAILGMLTLLQKTELTSKQADYTNKSEGAARALLGLINEILDFSKIEAGKMTLDLQPFEMEQLLRDLSVLLSTSVGRKPIELLYDIDPGMPRQLLGDAMRLQQVLLNLGSNALKFTAQGHVVLSMKVRSHSAQAVTLDIAMQDSGIGIAPENQARIFSGFTQAESSTTRRFGGTGLGLAISQRFIQMMGGELALQSALGEGSRFYFSLTLPLVTAPLALPAPANADTANGTPAWRVLMVDDDAMARETMRAMGQSWGWTVDLAASGEQAMRLLQDQAQHDIRYQAVFVDWQMPGLDGLQTSQAIRTVMPSAAMPIIVMVTAHGREILAQHSESDTLLDGYLVKPVTAAMLRDAVVAALARSNGANTLQAGMPLPAPAPVQRLCGMRLLLVEDNLVNQQVACELLEAEGAIVQIANNGQEGVEAVASTRPPFDVVLMDVQMPVMDGFCATRYIRTEMALADLPIVAMTANALSSDHEACLAAGMNDHVGKPFDLNTLVRVLHQQANWADLGRAPPVAPSPAITPAVQQAATQAGVDLCGVLQRMGGNQDLYERMLGTFLTDLASLPAQLRQLVQSGAHEDVTRLLHTLKGVAATVGAHELAAQAALCETQWHTPSPPAQRETALQYTLAAMVQHRAGLQGLLQALQNSTPHTAEPGLTPMEAAELRRIVHTLAEQLRADDMAAMLLFADFQRQFGAHLGERITPLEEAMAALDFDAALVQCEALVARVAL